MENESAENEDRLLRWIAGAMGFELHIEFEYLSNYEPDRRLRQDAGLGQKPQDE